MEFTNRQAIDGKLAYTEFLAMLISDEIARRDQKKFDTRLRRAQFRATKTFEQFDFDKLPSLNRALVHELASGRYLQEKAPVLIVGPCGTGKSHLAQALGHANEWKKSDPAVRAVSQIPGVGLLTATAAVAAMGDARAFRSGREFAAWAGLVPRQTGTGGKTHLHGISKRGDTYLRTLLIHGARSVLMHVKEPGPWVERMKQRRPANVVIVALANKMARTIWAVLAHGRTYQKEYVSVRPA
jgi:transposase